MKYPDLPGNIFKYRNLKRLTQTKLGGFLGKDSAQISLWENGRNMPTLPHAIALCEIFEINIYQLVGIDQPGEQPANIGGQQNIQAINNEKDKEIEYLKKLVASHEFTIELLKNQK